jgi:hypothetical protein
MGISEFKSALRHQRKQTKLSSDHCAICGNDDTRVLQSTNIAACAECRKRIQGQSIFEDHHIAGKQNSPIIITIPANQHAILSDMAASHDKTEDQEVQILNYIEDLLYWCLELIQNRKVGSVKNEKQ